MISSVLSGALALYPVMVHLCSICNVPQYAGRYLAVPVLYYEPVSRPIHLKVSVNTEIEWPEFDYVLSATVPLSDDLARFAQQ